MAGWHQVSTGAISGWAQILDETGEINCRQKLQQETPIVDYSLCPALFYLDFGGFSFAVAWVSLRRWRGYLSAT